MKSLVKDNGTICEIDDDRLWTLVDRNFFTKDQDPLEVEVEDVGYTIKEP